MRDVKTENVQSCTFNDRSGVQTDSVITTLMQDAETKKSDLRTDSPVFILVDKEQGGQVMTVSVTGHRGSDQSKETALVTGYYDLSTGQLTLAHALYFENEHRLESTIYANGIFRRDGAVLDEANGQIRADDGQIIHQSAPRPGVSFGTTAAAADGPYVCQKDECKITYQFFQILTCGIIGLATGGFGALLCGLATYALPEYVCNRIYYYC